MLVRLLGIEVFRASRCFQKRVDDLCFIISALLYSTRHVFRYESRNWSSGAELGVELGIFIKVIYRHAIGQPSRPNDDYLVEELRLASELIYHQIPHIENRVWKDPKSGRSGRVLRSGKYNNAGPYHQC